MSEILVKNHFFILWNKFNLHTISYDSLKFQTSITVVQSSTRPCVNFLSFKYLIRGVLNPIFLNFHFLNILTNSKCKGFYNSHCIKPNFFSMLHKVCVTKQSIQFFYISPTFQIKNNVHIVETRKFRKLSLTKEK